MSDQQATDGETLSPGKGAVVTLIVVVVLIAYLALANVVGVTQPNAGFIHIFYWTALAQSAPNRWLPSVLGCFAGLGFGWALLNVPVLVPGAAGMVVILLMLITAIWLHMTKLIPLVANDAFMLMLTIAAFPPLLNAGQQQEMLKAHVLATIVTGVGLGLALLLAKRKSAAPA